MRKVKIDHIMTFGKYKGQTLDDISEFDPEYILWLHEKEILNMPQWFVDAVEMDCREIEEEVWYCSGDLKR